MTEQDIFDHSYDLLVQILRERPLNGRLMDTRHLLRGSVVSLIKILINQVPISQALDSPTPDRARELILL